MTFFSSDFRTERSTDQVIKPVNLEALTRWVSSIPEDIKQDMAYIAPMLSKLGYDPNAYPPIYGDADKNVAENTIHIHNNDEYWRKKSQDVQNMKKLPRTIYNQSSAVDDDKQSAGLVQDHLDTEHSSRDKAKYGQDPDPELVKSQSDRTHEENDLIKLNHEHGEEVGEVEKNINNKNTNNGGTTDRW